MGDLVPWLLSLAVLIPDGAAPSTSASPVLLVQLLSLPVLLLSPVLLDCFLRLPGLLLSLPVQLLSLPVLIPDQELALALPVLLLSPVLLDFQALLLSLSS